MYIESGAVPYKTRLNSDAELNDFEELIILNLINNVAKARNTSISVSVLSRNDKHQIDSLVL